eukprot:12551093-Heterocapsa_arctica.AAC.1
MTMDFACFANAGRKVVCSIFGGNAKPAIRSQILTGCNFRISSKMNSEPQCLWTTGVITKEYTALPET